jgi:hypothetical protein
LVALLNVYLLLKVIQEYVLGEFDADATDAYHENRTSESEDEDHVKDTSKRYYTKTLEKYCCIRLQVQTVNYIWKQNSLELIFPASVPPQISCPPVLKCDCM